MTFPLMNLGLVLVLSAILSTVLASDGDSVDYFSITGHVFKTIFHKYNERVRPYKANVPAVTVNIDLSLVRVGNIDYKKNEIETIFDIVVSWEDGRLYWYSDIIRYVTVNSSTVWTPDVAFLNAERSPEVIINPRFILVDSDGNVFWSRRMLLRTSCMLNHTSNTQECPIILGSSQLPKQEQIFGDANCTLGYSFGSTNVNISDISMLKTESPLQSRVFRNSNVSEAHCTVSFQQDTKQNDPRSEMLTMDNGQDIVVSNTAFIIGILAVVMKLLN